MTTTHGVLDCRFTFADDYWSRMNMYTEMYVSATKFLTSSQATSLGITRVAYSTGSAGTGSGYADEALHVGQNPWSVYKFDNSRGRFYMLIQACSNDHPNTTTGIPVKFDNATNASGFAVSFAIRGDLGSPWNGTTHNDGTDVKGTPVWTPGPSNLMVWPRSNSTGGANATDKENMMTVPVIGGYNGISPQFGCKMSIVADLDNIIFLLDERADNCYRMLYFGRYTPRGDMFPKPAFPYVCLRNASVDSNGFDFGTYGPTTSGILSADGGVTHPYAPVSGTLATTITSLSTFWNTSMQPASLTGPSRIFKFDEWPIYISVDEFPSSGYLGTIDWIRYCWGPECCNTNAAATRAYFGNNTVRTTRVSVPWNPVVRPSMGVNRLGTLF